MHPKIREACTCIHTGHTHLPGMISALSFLLLSTLVCAVYMDTPSHRVASCEPRFTTHIKFDGVVSHRSLEYAYAVHAHCYYYSFCGCSHCQMVLLLLLLLLLFNYTPHSDVMHQCQCLRSEAVIRVCQCVRVCLSFAMNLQRRKKKFIDKTSSLQ